MPHKANCETKIDGSSIDCDMGEREREREIIGGVTSQSMSRMVLSQHTPTGTPLLE